MSSSGFFGCLGSWGGGSGDGPPSRGRSGNHPNGCSQGPGGPHRHVSFEDKQFKYDLAKDGREFTGGAYPLRCALSDSEYKAHQQQIFQPAGPNPQQARGHSKGKPGGGVGVGLTRPPPLPGWLGEQVPGQPPAAVVQGPQGQQGQPTVPRFPQGHPLAPLPIAPAAGGMPQAQAAQQGGTQIAVQPTGAPGGAAAGVAQATAGVWVPGPGPQDYSGIDMALDCLSLVMMDADMAQNLRWQREVDGEMPPS
jgi:hypothetical protein